MDTHTNANTDAALTFHETTPVDAAALAFHATRYTARIGAPVPPPVIEDGKPTGFVVRYPLPEATTAQAIRGQELAGLPLFEG